MAWIKIGRTEGGPKKINSVRCVFTKPKKNPKYILRVYISIDIIEKLGFDIKKKINFYLDEYDPKIWLIKQDEKSALYSLSKLSKNSYCVGITWDYFSLPPNCNKVKELKYDFCNGGLRIYYED